MSSDRIFWPWRIKSGISIFLFFLLPAFVFAQEVELAVRGGFLSDSIKIGEQTAYYLSARYPSQLTILFPDSTHSFSPFEYQRKSYFATETTEGISVDSTVYYLTTFEVDRVQYLQLPVYIAHALDSTVVQTRIDSLLITQFVEEVPDTVSVAELPLRMNTAYQRVHYDLNFWLIVIAITVFSIVALVVWLTFGARIKQYFKARKLQKNHAYFLERYDAFLRQLQTAFSTPATESALATWKNYMEQLESRPYTKLTTRETLSLIKEPAVTEDLRRIDNAIYGHNTTVVESLQNLRLFADHQFKRKLREVRHGK
jgi:type II secretory pathway pseudopilin PulG